MNNYAIDFEFDGKSRTCIKEVEKAKCSEIMYGIYFTEELKPLTEIVRSKITTAFTVRNEPKYILRIVRLGKEGNIAERVEMYEVEKISYFLNKIYVNEIEEMELKEAEKIYEKCKKEIIEKMDCTNEFKCSPKDREKVTLEDLIYAYVLMHFKRI